MLSVSALRLGSIVAAVPALALALALALPLASADSIANLSGQAHAGMTLRHAEALNFQAALADARATPSCLIENGFDYVGNDIANAPGPVDSCCAACAATSGCRAWSWSNLNGGTCWLKAAQGDIVVNANVKSAVLSDGPATTCALQSNLDYVGNDLARVSSASPGGCCDLCRRFLGCRAYSWSDYLGGSCWLKSKRTDTVAKTGVQSALAYPDVGPQRCNPLETNVDYVGNDLTSRPSASVSGCCDICRAVAGCVAFSWTSQSGGTCYLKGYKGATAAKTGVVSAQVLPNPSSACALEYDVDFVSNDLTSRPSAIASDCCGICRGVQGCNAFSWSNLNGGTCWLKSGKGATVSKPGVTSASVWTTA